MTFEEFRDINHRVRLYKTDKEIAKNLSQLRLGIWAATILASLTSRNLTQFDFMQIFDSVKFKSNRKSKGTKKSKKKSKGNKKSKINKKSRNKIQKQKNQFKVAKGLSELREVFLFNWDDDNGLKDFLRRNYDIKWVETA